VNFGQVESLLTEIRETQGFDKFVVVGSLSVLGLIASREIPTAMLVSNELDGYPESDPGRREEVAKRFGQGTPFEFKHGYYFDPVSPTLPTLPDGWRERLIEVTLKSGVLVKFLEPNDAAVSKYARCAPKDREWIRAGLDASILSAATIEHRFRFTPFLDRAEHERAKVALAEDLKWLRTNARGPRPDS
jgi:hypothetical protein